MSDSDSPEELEVAKVAAVVEEAPATEATDEASSSSSKESQTSSTDEAKPTTTSVDKTEEDTGDATGTAIYAWASPSSGSMQVFDDKLNHVLLPGVSNGLTYVLLSIRLSNSLQSYRRDEAVQICLSKERR